MKMKRVFTVASVLLLMVFAAAGLAAQEERGVSVGVHILGGGRYDNVRMCVGSPAGVIAGGGLEVHYKFEYGN